ncbi:hypothetical protein ACQPYK_43120 [Streptosporangium sp. CA-135522]|uniref:hypothetical protein n=1 Tax=Streptosporangium sp. CA-135522 TaxID=3240072 RepID=UPI003D916609
MEQAAFGTQWSGMVEMSIMVWDVTGVEHRMDAGTEKDPDGRRSSAVAIKSRHYRGRYRRTRRAAAS